MGDIKVRIGVDGGGLRSGLSQARSDVNSFANQAGGALRGFGATVAGVFSVGAIVTWVKSIGDAASEIQDMSDRLNLGTESLQGLTDYFGESGANAQVFDKGITKLNQTLDDARNGNDKAILAFERMGMTWEDIVTKSPDEILRLLADYMRNATDSTESLSVAMDILGKSGSKMAAGLREGSDAIDAYVAASTKFNDFEIKQIDKAFDDLGRTVKKTSVEVAQFWMRLFNSKSREGFLAQIGIGDIKTPASTHEENLALWEKVDARKKKAKENQPAQAPLPEDPRIAEAAKKNAEEMAKFDKLISDTSDKEAKARLEEERACLLEEIELARKAGEERKKIEEEQVEHNRQQYHEWLVDKDRMNREAAANQRQQQINDASEAITAREKKIDEKLKTPEQRRSERDAKKQREKAGREIQRAEDEAAKVDKQNKVDRPNVFKGEDPRKKEQFGPPVPKKGKEQSPAEAMGTDIAEIKGHIATLVSKINVK